MPVHRFVDLCHEDGCEESDKQFPLHRIITVDTQPPKVDAVLEAQEAFFHNVLVTVHAHGLQGIRDIIADQDYPSRSVKDLFQYITTDADGIAGGLFF